WFSRLSRCVCVVGRFFLSCSGAHRDLHSFPTRRSSDLADPDAAGGLRRHLHALADPVLHGAAAAGDLAAVPHRDGQCVLPGWRRSEEHTSELQSRENLVCRLLLEKKKKNSTDDNRKTII